MIPTDYVNYPMEWISGLVLSKDSETYEFEFVLHMESNSDFILCYNLGCGKGDYVLQNVVLERL